MALKLGSLYVSLTARTSAFSKGMSDAMGALERFTKEAKKVSADVAQFAGALSVIGIGALKLASTVDGPTKSAMMGLENSTKLLAVQVADMLLPAVHELTSLFKQAASAVASLDPELKKQISTFAVMAVQVAAAAKAFSMLSGLASSAFGVLKSAFSMLASVGLAPLLEIALAVAAVIAVVVLLHRAWRKNWGGIQEATQEVVNWLRDAFGQFGDFMGKVWNFLIDGAARFVEAILGAIDAVQELTGKKVVNTAGLREGIAGLWKDLKSGSFFSDAFKFGKTVGQQMSEGLVEELSVIKAELMAKLGLDKMFGGGGKTIGLGRSAGKSSPRDPSGHEFMADESMRLAAQAAAYHLQEVAAEADAFKKRMADVQIGQEIRAWLKSIAQEPTTTMRGGLASVSLSDAKITSRRFGGGMTASTDSNKRANAMADAVGAASWDGALTALKEGLGRAATFGEELAAWGARMGPLVASAGKQLLGAVGDLVGSIVEGAQQGGVWGAIIAAFMEIAKKTESAMKFLDVAMEFVKRLAEMVEPLVKPIFDALTDVLGIVVQIIAPVFAALKPLFEAIAKLVKYLSPILYAIGDILLAIAPILEVIGNVLGVVMDALKPILDLVAGLLKVIATVILGIIIGLNELAGVFGDEKAKAESARLKGIVDKMWARTGDNAIAQGEAAGAALRNAAAQNTAAEAASAVAESLSNVPSGYKLALSRFNADLGIGAAPMAAAAAGGGSTVIINGGVHVTSDPKTAEELAEDAEREANRDRGQRTGNPRPRRDRGDW